MEASFFQYQGKYYRQIYGTPMGSPLSPILADIVLESIIKQALQALPFQTAIIKKYVDDLFISFPKNESNTVLETFNLQEKRLQFTLELENNGHLPYLDMLIIRNNNQTITTEWYAKPIASGRMLNFNSFHHIRHKINTANNFIHRINYLSTNQDQTKRNRTIYHHLTTNNYPRTLISRLINTYKQKEISKHHLQSSDHLQNQLASNINTYVDSSPNKPSTQLPHNLENKTGTCKKSIYAGASSTQPPNQIICTPAGASSLQPPIISPPEQTPEKTDTTNNENHSPAINTTEMPTSHQCTEKQQIYLPMPYIPMLTDKVIKLLRRNYSNVTVATKQYSVVGQIHTKVKDPENKGEKSNIIYEIPCSNCNSCYIGMTTNKLNTRLSGHRSTVNKLRQIKTSNTNTPTKLNELKQKTALIAHCIDTQHEFDFSNTKIIDRSYRSHTLEFLEMCYIKSNSQAVNKKVDIDGLNSAYAAIIDTLAKSINRRR